MRAHIDFETASLVDLKKEGLYRYATSEDTFPLMLGYAMGDEPAELTRSFWHPNEHPIADHVAAGGTVVAHNAQFEYNIWNSILVPRYKWPRIKLDQLVCTMATAYSMALPGSLEMVAAALGLPIGKDKAGHALMMKLTRPFKLTPKIIWHWERDSFTFQGKPMKGVDALPRLGEYCVRDVEVEREVDKRLVHLSPREREMWIVDQIINERGIPIDMAAVHGGRLLRDELIATADDRMKKVTDGAVGSTTALPALKEWLADQGVFVESLDKAHIEEYLEMECLPEAARTAMRLRSFANRATSVKKLDVIANQEVDGRMRYCLQYHGSRTGRWAGRALQPHNEPRDLPDIEVVDYLMDRLALNRFDGIDLKDASQCLRGFTCAQLGLELMGSDWSNVEGRGTAWVAGEQWKLDAFAHCDAHPDEPDMYEQTYAKSFGIDPTTVTKDQRQIGKVQELAFGYQGGVGACHQFAGLYGLDIVDEVADEWKVAWRGGHPFVVQYWKDIEAAAIGAVMGMEETACGPAGRQVKFKVAGSFLWCLLPSGRTLCYPYPKLMEGKWGRPMLTYKSVPSQKDWTSGNVIKEPGMSRNWARISTYGGKLTENVVQAICRDILAEAIRECERNGLPVVKHVHDEIIVEGIFTDYDLGVFQEIMNRQPAWAAGFPIAADCWKATRYQK